MSKKEAALWVLTFLACAAMILGPFVAFALLQVCCEMIDRDDFRMRWALYQAFSEARDVADTTAWTVVKVGPPQRAPQAEDWSRRLSENLNGNTEDYEVLSPHFEPAPDGYYVAVVQPVHKVADGSGGTRTVPWQHKFTVVVSASDRGDSKVVVLRSPDPSEARSGEPTVMVRLRSPNWDSLEEFVATPEFWKQDEPDLLAAFPGRSVDETPLPQFFEPFNPK